MVLEGTDGFTVEPGGTAEMGGTFYGAEGSGAHFFEVGLDFAQAERVTSYAELRDALEAGAGAIAVEGDILLRGGEALTVGVPLLVPEGSSLTTAQGVQPAVLALEGGLLLNRGEVQCVVHTVDGRARAPWSTTERCAAGSPSWRPARWSTSAQSNWRAARSRSTGVSTTSARSG